MSFNVFKQLDSGLCKFTNRFPEFIPTGVFVGLYADLFDWICKSSAIVGYAKLTKQADGFNSGLVFNDGDNEYWCHIPDEVAGMMKDLVVEQGS